MIVLTLADGTYGVHHVRVSDGANLPGFPVIVKPAKEHGSRSTVILPGGQGYALGLATDHSFQVASIGRRGQLTADPEVIAEGASFTRPVRYDSPTWAGFAWEEELPDGSSRPGAALRSGDTWRPVPVGETDRRVQGRPALFPDPAGMPTVVFSTWDGGAGLTSFTRVGDPATGAWGPATRLTTAPGDCCFAPVGLPGGGVVRHAGPSTLVGAAFDGAGFDAVLRAGDGALTTLGDAGGAFPHPVATAFGRGPARDGLAVAWIAQGPTGVRVAGGGMHAGVLAPTPFGRGARTIDGLNIAGDGRGNGIAAWMEDVGGRERPAAAVFDAVRPQPRVQRVPGTARDFVVSCGAREGLGCEARFAAFRPGSARAVRVVDFRIGRSARRVRLSRQTVDGVLGSDRDSGLVRVELRATDRAGNVQTVRRTVTVRR